MRAAAAERGFTLLEILVAIAIFAFIAGAAMTTMANSGYLAAQGQRARQLRALAERKLGEVLVFEANFDEIADGDFRDCEEVPDQYRDWSWNLDIRDVVVFGVTNQQDAQYLFGQPSEEDLQEAASTSGAPGGSGQQQRKGETQQVRELILRVLAPADESGQDSVEIVTFMPLVKKGSK